MTDPRNPADGQYVVIQDGQRVTGPLTEQQAIAEAERRKALAESQGGPNPPKVEIKQNLFGAVALLLLPNVVTVCGTTFMNWY